MARKPFVNELLDNFRFIRADESAFKLLLFEKDEVVLPHLLSENVIFFCLSGRALLSCDSHYNTALKGGEMVLMPSGSRYCIRFEEQTEFVSCSLSPRFNLCFPFALSGTLPSPHSAGFGPIPIHEKLQSYLDLLKVYVKDEVFCRELQEWKQQELLLLFYIYYSKEELLRFFAPVLSLPAGFRESVIAYSAELTNLSDLADRMNCSVSTFKRRFKACFHEPASQWLARRKSEAVWMDLKNTDKSLSDIALDHGFSSQAHLSKFCKDFFGVPPGFIRKNPHFTPVER